MIQRLQHYLGTGLPLHLLTAVFFFITSLAIGWLVKKFLETVGRRISDKTETKLDDEILDVVLPRVKWFAIVIGLYLAVEEIGKGTPSAEETAHQLIGYARGGIYVAFVSLISFLAMRLADTSLQYAMESHARKTASKLNEDIFPLVNRLVNTLIGLVAIITLLDHFGVNVNSLLVFLGGSSVAIALAAQETLSNMIAGFVIMLDRPFRVGDRIRLPSGEVGDVYEIGLRSTKVLDFDNNTIVSPNADLIKTKLINYSYPELNVRVSVEVGVAYGTDVDKAKKMIIQLSQRHPGVLKSPIPEVFLVGLGDSAVNLQLVARTDDFKKKFRIETALREQIYNAFQREGIEIPFPQRVVHLSDSLNGKPQNPQKRKALRR